MTSAKINTVVAKNAATAPPWATSFRCWTQFKENPKGKYYIVQVSQKPLDKKYIEGVETLATYVQEQPPAPSFDNTDQPEI